jgi:hypothetical protein
VGKNERKRDQWIFYVSIASTNQEESIQILNLLLDRPPTTFPVRIFRRSSYSTRRRFGCPLSRRDRISPRNRRGAAGPQPRPAAPLVASGSDQFSGIR